MSAVVRKSLTHLGGLFKVYLILGLLGALVVVACGFLVSHTVPTIMAFIGFSLVLAAILMRLEANTLNRFKAVDDKQPPTPPESFKTVMLPPLKTDLIIGDPGTGFIHLQLKTPLATRYFFAQIGFIKYGRRSARTRYAIDAIRIILHLWTPYFAVHFGKRHLNQIEKTLARA